VTAVTVIFIHFAITGGAEDFIMLSLARENRFKAIVAANAVGVAV
jgi:hypothetical protein